MTRALRVLVGCGCVAALLTSPATSVAQSGCFLIFCPTPGSPPPSPSPPPPPPPPPVYKCSIETRLKGADFAGVDGHDVFWGDADYRRCELSRQARNGVGVIRVPMYWSFVEKTSGQYDFSFYDDFLAEVARHGIRTVPILWGPPDFHLAGPPWSPKRRLTYPPRRNSDFAAFAARAAQRYGPSGSFWKERRDIPFNPIRSWIVWNEPNLRIYWPRGPNPKQYVAMLSAVARGLKRVEPRAEVVTAGFPDSRTAPIALEKYIDGMYDAGAKSAFDAIALHPYARDAAGSVGIIKRIRRLMNRHGDRRAGIWVGEFGWASGGPPHPYRAGITGQAERTEKLLKELYRQRSRLRIRGALYTAWIDAPPYREDFWGLHLGLNRLDGTPKPALDAFRRGARPPR